MILKPAARREYDDAYDWYALSDPKLGDRFEAFVEAKLEEIESFPTRFPVILGNTREAIVSLFPFSIMYRIEADEVIIVAVYHHSRKPFGWRHR